MSAQECIGKQGYGIPTWIFSGESLFNRSVAGGSGHGYLATVAPDHIRILDEKEPRLRFEATVKAGLLELDIQSYLFRDDHRIISPDLFIGRLYPYALRYFQAAGTRILWKHDRYQQPVEEEGLHGESVFCPNDNYTAFVAALGGNMFADEQTKQRAALSTWSGIHTAQQGFSYHGAYIVGGFRSIQQIRVYWEAPAHFR